MCDTRDARAAQLRRLAQSFETMAGQDPEPRSKRRLQRAARDLLTAVEQSCAECATCAAGDVIWADEPPRKTAAGGG